MIPRAPTAEARTRFACRDPDWRDAILEGEAGEEWLVEALLDRAARDDPAARAGPRIRTGGAR
jgi:hypothetical protein